MDIKSQLIELQNNTRRVDLGENNKNVLILPNGAIPQRIVLKYRVDPILVDGQRGAGVMITPDPLNPPDFEFEEPVELRLSYEDCGEFKGEENTKSFVILKTSLGVTFPIGGAKIKKKDFVSVAIDSFSKFAIAIN